MLGDSARELSDLLGAVRERLDSLALTPNPRKCRVFPVTEGCDFVGYRIWPEHRLLRRHSGYRFRRRYPEMLAGRQFARLRTRVGSWIAHARHADTWGLRRAILGGTGGPS